jgi:hypothetical protein
MLCFTCGETHNVALSAKINLIAYLCTTSYKYCVPLSRPVSVIPVLLYPSCVREMLAN